MGLLEHGNTLKFPPYICPHFSLQNLGHIPTLSGENFVYLSFWVSFSNHNSHYERLAWRTVVCLNRFNFKLNLRSSLLPAFQRSPLRAAQRRAIKIQIFRGGDGFPGFAVRRHIREINHLTVAKVNDHHTQSQNRQQKYSSF